MAITEQPLMGMEVGGVAHETQDGRGRPETGERRAGGGHRVGKGGGRREQQGSPAGTRTCVCTRTAVPERAVLDLWTVGRSAPGVTRAQLAVLRDASGTLIHVGTVATVIRVP